MRRPLLRLIPALFVAACAAGEVVLPPPPASASAQSGLERVTLTWSAVSGASHYLVLAATDPSLAGAQRTEVEAPPLELPLAGGPWYFGVSAVRDGFRSAGSPILEATPLVSGTGGLAPLPVPAWIGTSGQIDARFGFPVAGAGDVNGDGFDDVLIGAFETGAGGSAYLYRGSPSGLESTPAWTSDSPQGLAQYAKGLAAVGDIDGDGAIDVAVGATEWTNGQASEGRALLFLGSAGTFASAPAWMSESDQTFAWEGRFVASLGDANGDDADDFVVTRHGFDGAAIANEGRVMAFYGGAGIPPTTPDFFSDGGQNAAYFGYALSPRPGDLDGDGFDDLLAAAYNWSSPAGSFAGAVRVYRGGPSGLEPAASFVFEGTEALAELGGSVSFAGDVNADGYDDVIAGAWLADAAPSFSGGPGSPEDGRAILLLGSPTGFGQPAWSYEGSGNERLGMGVGAAGDVNADGYDDLLVGAWAAGGDEGRALLFLGGPAGPGSEPALVFQPGVPGGYAGGVVAGAGDVNGDGSADFVVGTASMEYLVVDSRVYLFLGAPGRGPAPALAPAELTTGIATALPATVAYGGTGLVCTWDFGDGGVVETVDPCDPSLATAPPHTWQEPGEFLVRFRAENAFGLQGDSFAWVRVSD